MDVVTVVVMVAAFMLSALPEKKVPPKTAEQEFGEAVTKFLSKGVKVRLEVSDKKE
jgi:beta-lactam-binding protein with PASTA domain